MRLALVLSFFALLLSAGAQQPSTDTAWKPVEQAMQRSGQLQPDGVMKFGMPPP